GEEEEREDGGHADDEERVGRIEEVAANVGGTAEPAGLAHDTWIAAPADDAELGNYQGGSHRRQDLRQRLEVELAEDRLLDCEAEERGGKSGPCNRLAGAVMLEEAPRDVRGEEVKRPGSEAGDRHDAQS